MISAFVIGLLWVRSPDVVIATSPQLLCAAAGYGLARLLRAPFVFEVRDLWPETITTIAAMRENVVIRCLRALSAFLYEHATRIVTVGEGYTRGIHARYGIAENRFSIVPNGIDTDLFVPGPRDNEVRREYGWGNRFVALYIGTHGMCHGLGRVLQVAKLLKDEPNILFAFVGEGAEKGELKALAQECKLSNVQFIDGQPKVRVPLFYAACDVGIVSLLSDSFFEEVLPSKIFEYMGMEKPILSNVGGEAQRLIEAAGAGSYVPLETPEEWAEVLREWATQPEKLSDMGQRGRQYVLQHFDRRVLARRYLELLETVRGSVPPKQRAGAHEVHP